MWILTSILAALGAAGMVLTGEWARIRAMHLMFWLRVFAVAALSPGVFFIPWPDEPAFYVIILLTALMMVYADVVNFGLAAVNGAGVVSRIGPLSVGLTFVLWVVITPSLLINYAQSPLRGAGILLAITGAVLFSLRLKNCALSWHTMKNMALPIFLSALAVIFGKICMDLTTPLSGIFYYIFLQGVGMIVIYTILFALPSVGGRLPRFDMESQLFSKKVMIAGLLAASFHLLHMVSKYYAFDVVSNPAYVTMIGLSMPLFILLAYFVRGQKEEADILSGLGVVASILLLVISTRG